ncbi:Major Facilitator Superfamily (MFS) [Phytophthora nicotianae]|uniref:Molybdate-anion transporter n=1 Tax=Phytophthora nicotianae TaxID=4792 RepID=A0A0W8C5W6_PHYNI|nr:Major Facilitator Superfamily (MFS) [Phytophthora nicotianae]
MSPMWLANALQWPVWASSCCLGLLMCLLSLHIIEKLFVVQRSSQKLSNAQPKTTMVNVTFAHFQQQYLVVYGLVMFADWLQGTHMYSLYHIVINILEDVPIMAVLLVGRVLGGISTSLLFSAFESWMVTEHRQRGFADSLLGKTFALGSEINGVVAVIAGLVAQLTADAFGDIGPFRAAVVVTAIATLFVFSWSENYGSPSGDDSKEVQKAEHCGVTSNSGLTLDSYALGLCYSLFEGAMYVFGKPQISITATSWANYSYCSVPVVSHTGSCLA